MMKLIDKDALVAMIDKRLHQLTDAAFDSMIGRTLIEIKDFIDTLEVKEVGLEKELKYYCSNYYNCDYPKQLEECTCSKVMPHIVSAAKHFFELGLKARKGE